MGVATYYGRWNDTVMAGALNHELAPIARSKRVAAVLVQWLSLSGLYPQALWDWSPVGCEGEELVDEDYRSRGRVARDLMYVTAMRGLDTGLFEGLRTNELARTRTHRVHQHGAPTMRYIGSDPPWSGHIWSARHDEALAPVCLGTEAPPYIRL